jgi:hypothetical protein
MPAISKMPQGGKDDQRWKHVKAHLAKGDKAKDKAEQHYISAGQYLKALKAEHKGTWAEWETLVKEHAGIGKSRASELMQIAGGTRTVKQIRDTTTKKVRRIRARKSSPVRTGEKPRLNKQGSAGEPTAAAGITDAAEPGTAAPAPTGRAPLRGHL